jgi:hypothetical protein
MGFITHVSWAGMFAWVDCEDDMAREIIRRFNSMNITAPVRLVISCGADLVPNVPISSRTCRPGMVRHSFVEPSSA